MITENRRAHVVRNDDPRRTGTPREAPEIIEQHTVPLPLMRPFPPWQACKENALHVGKAANPVCFRVRHMVTRRKLGREAAAR
jgi:hypothetical protein